MYEWYGRATVCYADVSSAEDPRADQSDFRSSWWLERGWTLQELIAPETGIPLQGLECHRIEAHSL